MWFVWYEVALQPFRFGEKPEFFAAAFALLPSIVNRFEPRCPLGSLAVQTSEHTERSNTVEGVEKFNDLGWFPRCEVRTFHRVFRDLVQIFFPACVSNPNDATETPGCFLPCLGKLGLGNESGVNEGVQVEMPAVAFVRDFD